MLIARAGLLDGGVADIRLDGAIVEVGDRLAPQPGEQVYDARGGTVLPGLHDHHMHLRSAAAALASVPVGPPRVCTPAQLREALRAAHTDADGWIRAVGYHDSVAGALDRQRLDALSPAVPVRVQHRSGALWILNSTALDRIGRPDHPDGLFFRTDPAIPHTRVISLRPLSERLTAHGVTGITDATPGHIRRDIETFTRARQSGQLAQRLYCMAVAGTEATSEVDVGPAKIILDDTALDLDVLCRSVAENHAADHPVAVHAVTDSQLVVTIAALREVGVHPGDRIEHAAVVPDDCIADLVELGVTVVTQPNFVAERGSEYRMEVPVAQHDQLWRVASLQTAGVPVALSTDSPFGDGDPWATMRAAVHRSTPDGAVLGVAERISPRTAIQSFIGRPDRPADARRIAPGQPGDLCILSVPPRQVLAELDADLVAATVIGGVLIGGG